MGYLGKISAVVGVSTGDFSSKLNRCASDVSAFSKKVQNTLSASSGSAAKSFDQMYTAAQRFERSLRAATSGKLDFAGLKNFPGKTLDEAADAMRSIQSVAHSLSGPLGDIAQKSERMSHALQEAFRPALVAAQAATESLRDTVETTGKMVQSEFMAAEKQVDRVTQAFERLTEAEQMAGKLSSGKEFRFQQPAGHEELSRAATTGGSVSSLPTHRLTPDLIALIQLQKEAANGVAQYNAALQANPSAKAQSDLDQRVLLLREINDEISRELSSYSKLDAQAAHVKTVTNALIDMADAQKLAFSGQAQNLAQVSSQYDGVLARITKLTAAQRQQVEAAHGADLNRVGVSVASPGDEKTGGLTAAQLSSAQSTMAAANATIDSIHATEATAKKASDATEAAAKATQKSVDDLNARLGKISDSIGTPSAPIDALDAAVKRATADVEKMKDVNRKAQGDVYLNKLKTDVAGIAAPPGGLPPKDSDISALARRAGKVSDFANQKQAADIFGPAFGTAERSLDQLKTKIISVGGQLEKLPIPIQGKLAPAIARVQQMFVALGNNPTAAQLKQAAAEAEKLEKRLGRVSQAMKFKGKFSDFIDENSGKAYEAQLASIQQRFLSLGAAAGGPTAAAINQYRVALAKASVAGTLGTKAVRDQMEQLAASIAKAAQAEGLLNKGQAASFLTGLKKNFGDVGRGGADKFAMGMNQAAFAVDDFMSATGGIEQRLRAVANNVTQLGFVMGGTTGLFIALGAVITAHAAIALYKFANGGRAAEDTSKVLNDALDKQKNTVKELADAYADLAKEMARSADAAKGIERAAKIGKLEELRRTTRRQRSGDFSEGVMNETTLQESLSRRMKTAWNPGRAISLQMEMESSRAREGAARSGSRAGVETITAGQLPEFRRARASVSNSLTNSFSGQFKEATGLDLTYADRRERIQGEKTLAELDAIIKKFEDSVSEGADKLARNIVVASLSASDKISAAQANVADAIGKGVKGAAAFQFELDSAGRALSNAMMALHDAALETDPDVKATLTQQAQKQYRAATDATAGLAERSRKMRLQNGIGGERATAALADMQGNVHMRNESAGKTASLQRDIIEEQIARENHAAKTQAAAATAAAADTSMREAAAKTRESRNAQRLAEEDLTAKQEQQRLNPRENLVIPDPWENMYEKQVREAQASVEAAKAAVQAAKDEQIAVAITAGAQTAAADAEVKKAEKELEAAQAAAEFAAAIAEAAMAVEEAVSRLRKVLDDAMSSATSVADAAQKKYTESPGRTNKAARDKAEENLIDDRERIAHANNRLSRARTEAEADPEIKAYSQRSEQIRKELKDLEEDTRVNATPAGQKKMQDLRDEQASMDAQRARRMRDLTKPEQEQADKVAQDVEERVQKVAAIEREKERVRTGKELAMSESERRKKSATDEADLVGAAAAEITDAGKREDFMQKYYENKKKEVQTALKGYEDERQNALIGGPSRAALNASDVTSSAGSSELNRLLRGDDASKDANFAEMKHQSELLAEIRDGIKDATGIIVD
jgi:hypothetical protein